MKENESTALGKLGNYKSILSPIRKRDLLIADLQSRLKPSSTRNKPVKEPLENLKPSFTRKLNQAAREAYQFAKTQNGKWSNYAGFSLTKTGVRDLAERLSVKTPEIYGKWETLDAIDFDQLPEAFVLKANSGSTTRGVLPLVREDDKNWRVPSSKRQGNIDDLLAPIKNQIAAGKIKGPFHAEQLLTRDSEFSLARDVKVYCFYGQPGLIRLIERNDFYGESAGKQGAFFDVSGNRVRNLVEVMPELESDEPPTQLTQLMDVAAKISLHTRLPHIRVDLYEFGKEIYFGEITPRCGARRVKSLGNPWDEYLGRLWEHAELRVKNDLVLGNINTSGPVERTGTTLIPEHLLIHPRES